MSNKPYIVCYMMTSADGRIDCPMTEKLPGVEEYYPLLDKLKFDAVLSGKTTAKLELAEAGEFVADDSPKALKEIVAKNAPGYNGYEIIVDTKGILLWKHNSEYAKSHIIILSEQVSKSYLDYLNSKDISYIVTGKDKIDLERSCAILKETFGIERLGIVGGPAINTAFLDAKLLDEIILLLGSGIDGRASYPTVFSRTTSDVCNVTTLKLVDVQAYDSGAVMIRWKTN